VTTLTLNLPARLNGWTLPMMHALRDRMDAAAADPDTGAVILTGTDPYYSAGVNLSSTMRLAHPRTLHGWIRQHNQELFEGFLRFPKPILAAVNGPAIGATVTSATLCDGILASAKATFSTPFAALGVTPEGCSSVLFARLMGEENAQRMLGPEGWKPTGTEAAAIGLADAVVPHEALLTEAQRMAEGWVAEGRTRAFRAGATLDELLAINAEESEVLASAFLDAPFLEGQYRFLRRKKKRQPAAMFYVLWRTRPLWKHLL
jgi:enoyl-CoA hydratase/carnithine racemase